MKKALVTGITGQVASYLAELLLEKRVRGSGVKCRSSSFNTSGVDPLYEDVNIDHASFRLPYRDLSHSLNLSRLISDIQPDEVYNLGARSHMTVSLETPEYTAHVDAFGSLRILEASLFLGLGSKTRFYQSCTSEMYGLVRHIRKNWTTSPCSSSSALSPSWAEPGSLATIYPDMADQRSPAVSSIIPD